MLSPDNAIAFHIGNFPVMFYSITMFFAIVLGTALSMFIAKKYYKTVDSEKILDILPIVIIFAILGARLYYVFLGWDYYSQHLNEILAFNKGGLAIHGALIGGILAGIVVAKKQSLNFWQYMDVYSYGIILGQAVGRIGNYFNVEAFGRPCFYSQILCLYVPESKRPFSFIDIEYFHPAFLYEILWNLLVLFVLFFVVRKIAKDISGVVFFSYLGLYSIGRFFLEFVRVDSVLNFGSVHVAQVVSFLIVVLAVIGLCWRYKVAKIQ